MDDHRMPNAVAAAEYLVAYVDRVLEAFQVGTGMLNNAPEPITLDIARRLIWNEIRKTIFSLDDGGVVNSLWLRLDCEADIALEVLDASNAVTWTIRCFGPRKPEDHTVCYAVGFPLDNLAQVRAILTRCKNAQIGVRDWTYGTFPA